MSPSLIGFHRLLIGVGIVFCLGYGIWEARAWLAGGGGGSIGMATLFGLLAAALAIYLWNLDRVLRFRGGVGRPHA